jgi:hypothetical protein
MPDNPKVLMRSYGVMETKSEAQIFKKGGGQGIVLCLLL